MSIGCTVVPKKLKPEVKDGWKHWRAKPLMSILLVTMFPMHEVRNLYTESTLEKVAEKLKVRSGIVKQF